VTQCSSEVAIASPAAAQDVASGGYVETAFRSPSESVNGADHWNTRTIRAYHMSGSAQPGMFETARDSSAASPPTHTRTVVPEDAEHPLAESERVRERLLHRLRAPHGS
jgi:hypothetical protein